MRSLFMNYFRLGFPKEPPLGTPDFQRPGLLVSGPPTPRKAGYRPGSPATIAGFPPVASPEIIILCRIRRLDGDRRRWGQILLGLRKTPITVRAAAEHSRSRGGPQARPSDTTARPTVDAPIPRSRRARPRYRHRHTGCVLHQVGIALVSKPVHGAASSGMTVK